jgi:hypothetical protein
MSQKRVRVERPTARPQDKALTTLRPSVRPSNPNLSKQQFR